MKRTLALTPFANCQLDQLEGTVKTYMDWMSIDATAWKGHLPDYMDIDAIQACPMSACDTYGDAQPEQAHYGEGPSGGVGGVYKGPRPVLSGDRINYHNISGAKTLMMAWKRLVETAPSFRREAIGFLRKFRTHAHELDSEAETVSWDGDSEAAIEDLSFMGLGTSANFGDQFYDCETVLEADSNASTLMGVMVLECSRIRSKHPNSMHLTLDIHGHQVDALVDMGASHSFVQKSLVERLGLMALMSTCAMKVRLADGHTHGLAGRISLPLRFQGQEHAAEAYVLDGKGPPLILGYPFFSSRGWMIDCGQKTVHDAEGNIICCHRSSVVRKAMQPISTVQHLPTIPPAPQVLSAPHVPSATSTCAQPMPTAQPLASAPMHSLALRTPHDVILQPGESQIITTGCRMLVPQGYVLHVQGSSPLLHALGVVPLSTLIAPLDHGEVSVTLLNTSHRKVHIHSGARFLRGTLLPTTPCRFHSPSLGVLEVAPLPPVSSSAISAASSKNF